MKITIKREFEHITFNDSSDFHAFQIIMTFKTNFYKKSTAKPYSFFVIRITSDNSLCFRKNLVERI